MKGRAISFLDGGASMGVLCCKKMMVVRSLHRGNRYVER